MNADDPRDPDIDAAYRATARDEPPRALDERILAAAHRAVSARPVPAGRSFAQRWRVPVALAATVVLSATVTLMVYESDQAPPMPEDLRPGKLLREDRRAPEPASPRAQDKESGTQAPESPTAQERSRTDSRRPAPRRNAADDADAVRQIEALQPNKAQSGESKNAPAPFPAERARPSAPPAAAAPPPPAAPRAKDTQAPVAKKRAAPAAAREESSVLRSTTVPNQQAPKEPSGLGAASAPAPESELPAAEIRAGALADRPVGRLERDSAAAAAQFTPRSPEDWIAEIRRLKKAGRAADANRLLAEYRNRFPDNVLPEDLRK